MFLAALIMATALVISSVAIYYSVAGLVAIFASAAVPIMIMGGALEVGKLVTAVWLHKYWNTAKWWLKTYLSMAVVVLMLISSMGIFGFLSKAHIEQTSIAKQNLAQIEQIDAEILNQQNIILSTEQRIQDIELQSSEADQRIQQQIDTEQQRIDTAYARVQPQIDRQEQIIQRQEQLAIERASVFQEQLDELNKKLQNLNTALANNDVRSAQTISGTEPDGDFGPGTVRAIERFRNTTQAQISELQDQILQIRSAPEPIADAARAEITRLRERADSVIDDSNQLISRLRAQLGKVDQDAIDAQIAEQRVFITQANDNIQQLNQTKFELETKYRGLEAEVGPIKYIAEFIYNDQPDGEILEKAVRWVIVVIIFVFDPLAVLLLIASQYTFEMERQKAIAKKPGRKPKSVSEKPIIVSDQKKNLTKKQPKSPRKKNAKSKTSVMSVNTANDELDRTPDNEKRSPTSGDMGQMEAMVPVQDNNNSPVPSTEKISEKELHTEDEIGIQKSVNSYASGEDDEIDEEYQDSPRLDEYNQRNSLPQSEPDKTAWKKDHPDETLKHYKTLFLRGEIEQLPWEGYASGKNSEPAYRQNGEQSESTLFNRIKRNS